MALGEYPLVNLGQVRELHFEARKISAAGVDPMAERKAVATIPSEICKVSRINFRSVSRKVHRGAACVNGIGFAVGRGFGSTPRFLAMPLGILGGP
jgi:hypothetical protein